MSQKVKYGISGAVAGTVAGFLGGGGGVLLVPLLIYFVKIESRKAFATSVFVLLPVCAVSAIIYLVRGHFDLAVSLPYLIGGAIGGQLSDRIFSRLPTFWLRRIFGALLILGGVRTLLL